MAKVSFKTKGSEHEQTRNFSDDLSALRFMRDSKDAEYGYIELDKNFENYIPILTKERDKKKR